MTTPGQSPGAGENPQQIGSGWNQDVTEDSVKQWARGQVMPGFGSAFEGQFDLFKILTNAITGGFVPAGMNPVEWLEGVMSSKWLAVSDMQEGQDALSNRLDLVEDISGYCNLYLGGDQYAPSRPLSSQNPYFLDFASVAPIGPTKNARPMGINSPKYGWLGGVLFESYGIWRVDTMFTAEGKVIIGGSANMATTLVIYDTQTDTWFTNKWSHNEIVGRNRTHNLYLNVVIPEGNRYMAIVGVKHTMSGSEKIFGGGPYSSLSVNRWDIRTDGSVNPPPIENVEP